MWNEATKRDLVKGGILGVIIMFLLFQNREVQGAQLEVMRENTVALVELRNAIAHACRGD